MFQVSVAGDTGSDNGLFNGGIWPSLQEAINAADELTKTCYCHWSGSWIDNTETREQWFLHHIDGWIKA